jgi:hypothetical protein
MHFYSRAAAGERHGSVSEADSDEENEEGDYTVYECPGLAPVSKIFILNKILMELKIVSVPRRPWRAPVCEINEALF